MARLAIVTDLNTPDRAADFAEGMDARTACVTREQACANARRVLDAARMRRDRDRALGRLAPQVEFILRRLERAQRALPAADGPREEALLLHSAGRWEDGETIRTSLRALERATGFRVEDVREALDHLAATGDIGMSRSNTPPGPVSATSVPASAALVISPDWHRINDRRPRPH